VDKGKRSIKISPKYTQITLTPYEISVGLYLYLSFHLDQSIFILCLLQRMANILLHSKLLHFMTKIVFLE